MNACAEQCKREQHAERAAGELRDHVDDGVAARMRPSRRNDSVTAGFMCAPERWPHGE